MVNMREFRFFFGGGGVEIRGQILFVRGHHGPISELKECDIFGDRGGCVRNAVSVRNVTLGLLSTCNIYT